MGKRQHWTRVRDPGRGPRSVLTSYVTLDKSFNFLDLNILMYKQHGGSIPCQACLSRLLDTQIRVDFVHEKVLQTLFRSRLMLYGYPQSLIFRSVYKSLKI